MQEEYGASFLIYALLLVWLAIGSLASMGRARKFVNRDGLQIAEASKWIKATMWVVFGLGVVICLLKPEFMPDYDNYERWYKWGDYKESMEVTFVFLRWATHSYIWLIAIYAILSVGIHILSIRLMGCNVWLSLLTFFSLWFVLHDMIQIRAAVASAICFLALLYHVGRKPIPYFALVTVGVLFHYSAVIFYPLYLLSPTKPQRWLFMAIIIISFVLYFMEIELGYIAGYIPIEQISHYAKAYASSHEHQYTEFGFTWLFRFAISVLMIYRIETIKEKYPYGVIAVKIYIISMLSYILFKDIPVMSGRISGFLGVANIFAFSMFPMSFPKLRHFLTIIIVVLMLYLTQSSIFMITQPNYIEQVNNNARKNS